MIVLIAPLDWGLGHATRCIPLIRALERAGHTVVPCASGAGARLLRSEFPHLKVERIPGHAMTYTRNPALLPAWLLAQLPLYLLGVWREARASRALARKHGAGLVIADGRYGFRAPGIPSVFVTHQLEILPPGPALLRALISPLLRSLNACALRGFSQVWVPDFAGPVNLSGTLGHPPAALLSKARGPQVAYIRPLCRFRPVDAAWSQAASGRATAPSTQNPVAPSATAAPSIDILALVSGPEPQRTLFEKRLHTALEALPGTKVLVRGVPGRSAPVDGEVRSGELTVFDHLPGDRLAKLLESAQSVVCRSGYTTMMELAGLAKANVLLVPTPGQPEQEYLARHARESGFAMWQNQDELDVVEGLRWALALPGFGRLASGPGEAPAGEDFTLSGWIDGHRLLTKS
jgi:hypothetical protein